MKNTLNLVLLVGGKSSRMGQDKSALKLSLLSQSHTLDVNAHGEGKSLLEENNLLAEKNLLNDMDFFEHALSLLCSLAKANHHIDSQIKISCRANQYECMQNRLSNLNFAGLGAIHDFELLLDEGVGVCEAIYMCLEKTQAPCLFIPCDAPFLTTSILQQLITIWHNTQSCSHDSKLDGVNISHHTTSEELSNTLLDNNSSCKRYASYVFSDKNTKQKQSLIAIYTEKALPYLALSIETKMPLQKAIPEEFVNTLYYSKEQEPFFQNLNTIKDLEQAKSCILQLPKV